MTAPPVLVYIVGRGHSGSTMLELLLNRNRRLAAMGELQLLALQIFRREHTRWVGVCSCDERPEECPVWSRVLDRLRREHGADLLADPFGWRLCDVGTEEEYGFRAPIDYTRYKLHRMARTFIHGSSTRYLPGLTGKYRQWIRHRDALATIYAEERSVAGVIDASKDPLQMRDIAAWSSLPVRILFLTRDPRGLAWSALRSGRLGIEEEARDWSRLNRRILELLGGIDSASWMQVSYEDICANTESTLAGIHNFIGVGREELTPAEERARRHTIAGNSTRFRDLDDIQEDVAWQRNLTSAQLATIRTLAGSTAADLHYDL